MKRAALLLLLLASVAQAQTVSLFLDEAPLADVAKLAYGEIAQQPYILTPAALEARQPLTISLRDTTPGAVVEHVTGLLKLAGYSVETKSGVVWIDQTKEGEDEIIVYKPRHRSAGYLAEVVQPLTGARSLLGRSIHQAQQQSDEPKSSNPKSAAGMIDRSEVDQIAFAVPSKDLVKLLKLLADLDTPSGEVLLKAAVYEVGTTKQDGSAVKLALSLAGIEAGLGGELSGNASIKFSFAGLDGVINALDRDSRFKSISRPQVRVKNGAEARFSVGQDVPVLGAQQLDRNGNPIQSVDYKQSGIILTAKPEIREEVIELDLTQELSNFVQTSTGVNNSPTLIKRSVNTRLSLVPGEVVILAGLQDSKEDGQQSRVPLFGWLLGDQSQQQQSEILVFIEAHKM